MNSVRVHLQAITAILRKDFRELLTLVLLAWGVFLIQPILVSMNFEGDPDFWATVQTNFYYVGYFLGALVMVSLQQQDPAASLNHDWLTRPISRLDWMLAKLAFLLLMVCLPIIVSRISVNLADGYGLQLSIAYALGIEKLGGVLAIPLLFCVALLTPTLRRAIFLLTLVFIVFLIPAWSVTRPLLELLGITLGSELGGMMWLQTLPMLIAGLVGILAIYGFYYARRQQGLAYAAFCGVVFILFFSVFPPDAVFNWERAIAVHKSMINSVDDSLEDAVALEFTQACFPAATGGENAYNGSNDAVLTQAAWLDRWRDESDAGGVTIATSVIARETLQDWIQPDFLQRELAVDWRVERIRSRAHYSADSLPESLYLTRSSTAVNRFSPISETETDYWLVPREQASVLASDPSTHLTIDYDLALLAPTNYALPTDGKRYELAEVGYCKAELDNDARSIEVDCLKRGKRPALVSAQLFGVDSSRVDNSYYSNFTADWLQVFGRTHTQLTLRYPQLVNSSTILVTAWNPARIFHKQVSAPGFLGIAGDACGLPGDAQYAAIERSNWSDTSAHEVSTVAVERGVRVEVLDWRNGDIKNAPTLFLLPGLGATAHSYDDVATSLAEKYNVVGMTRRGAGASSTPDHGYDIARLSEDILEVMATLQIESPVLVGMSIAGEELSYLGAHHPDKFQGLVYLDAAFDRTQAQSKQYRELNFRLPRDLPLLPAEKVSYAAMANYVARRDRPRNIPEGEIIASYDLTTGQIKHNPLYLDAVMMGLQAPRYTEIPLPALGVYAMPGSWEFMMEPWYDQSDAQVRAAVQSLYRLDRQGKESAMARFDAELPDSEVLVLEDGYHWVFLKHEQEVLDAIDHFVNRLH